MTRRGAVALAAVAACALALRCAFLVGYDEDIDALRFALGVERFDVTSLRPHAPFYPVYMAAAKGVAALGASTHQALGLVGATAGALVVATTALLAREVAGRRAGVNAALLALASPYLWLGSVKLTSDMTGTALFTLALWLAARARRVASEDLRTVALVLLGAAVGVRLSYFPIALACLFVIARAEGGGRGYLARSRDLAVGVVLWLVPLVIVGGPRALVRTTWIQAVGHFTLWGGSVVTVPSPLDRLRGITWGLWANVLGGPWSDTPWWRWLIAPILIALLMSAARAIDGTLAWARRHPELVVSAFAYFVWAALGQNTANKPRHFAPLAPLFVVALAVGADRFAARIAAQAAVALLCAVWAFDGARLVQAHLAPSPAAALVGFLRDGGEPGRAVATCMLDRMIGEGAPGRVVTTLRDRAALERLLDALPPEGALATSECLGPGTAASLEARGIEHRIIFHARRSRYVDPLWADLALVSLSPPPSGRTRR